MTAPLNLRRHPKAEAVADAAADPRLDEGLHRFNEGHHWHAHEAWEPLWMGLEGEDKLVVQGLIMAAALLHQAGRGVHRGVLNHWENVQVRLRPALPERWGIDLAGLLDQLEPYARAAAAGAPPPQPPGAVRIRRHARAAGA